MQGEGYDWLMEKCCDLAGHVGEVVHIHMQNLWGKLLLYDFHFEDHSGMDLIIDQLKHGAQKSPCKVDRGAQERSVILETDHALLNSTSPMGERTKVLQWRYRIIGVAAAGVAALVAAVALLGQRKFGHLEGAELSICAYYVPVSTFEMHDNPDELQSKML